MSEKQLSQHRHISFTAHYTGYIWYQMGMSHPALATNKGKFLTKLVNPFETWAERIVGGSMRTTLKQRHQMIDKALTRLIEQHPNLQVIEIAAGLSPRGWRFRNQYPNIRYIEVDLPDMAQVKQHALIEAGQAQAEVLAIDLFTPELKTLFDRLEQNAPVVIISEGLINYFTKENLQQLWQSFAQYGATFPEFYYLTDLYPEPTQHRLAKLIWQSSKLLKVMSRSAFSFHFQTPTEVINFFKMCGFSQVQVQQPSQDSLDVKDSEHVGDLVWFIQAKL
mgnify:CR=1 FL=1